MSERMTKLGSAIAENIIYNYGSGEFLSRLSDPFWFQAFGSVMGMDWHSSGITTSVVGALKRGLNPRAHELGIYICGGRGRHSRNTPDELRAVAEKTAVLDPCGTVTVAGTATAGLLLARLTTTSPADFESVTVQAVLAPIASLVAVHANENNTGVDHRIKLAV